MALVSRTLFVAGAASALAVGLLGAADRHGKAEAAPPAAASADWPFEIAGMRRITEAQYRNIVADVFGPGIKVSGRFEPIVRPVHELIASGARSASISPAGLEQFDALGRSIAAQVFDEKRRAQFMPCAPQAGAFDTECARRTLLPIGRYLFRRPLTAQEEAFYVGLASDAAANTDFHKGLELSLAAMLVSPNFLYVIETVEPDPAMEGGKRLDNYATAARLSFLLWNTTPNEALLEAAARGDLTQPAKLAAVARRMTASPRFEQGVRAFFADMLLFEKFDEIAKDPLIFPYFNQDVAKALPEQMLMSIVDQTLTRDGDYRDLFTASRTFMNRPLASLYRVKVGKSDGWAPFAFGPGDERAGLLGSAGFLAMYSHSGRSSPTLRGRAIRELLMCQPVPDPPGNVNFTAVQDTENKAMPTARIRLTAHNTDPVCAGCHSITDPIGLALEKFDGIGAWRAAENGAMIDTGGELDGIAFDGPNGLGKAMAANPATTQCVASRALEYAQGASPEEEGGLLEPLVTQFEADGFRLRKLFERIAASPATYRVQTKPLETGPTRIGLAGQ